MITIQELDAVREQMMIVNSVEPYDWKEYNRLERIWKGLVMVYAEGDEDWFEAIIRNCYATGEGLESLLSHNTKQVLLDN